MKVALIGTRGVPARYGGFETYAEELGSRLAARGHRVLVTCRRHLYPDRRSSYRGMELAYPPSVPGVATDTFSHTLCAVLPTVLWRPDAVLMCNVANAPLALLLRAAGARVVIHVDGVEWKRRKWGPVARTYLRWAAAVACRVAHGIISDSRAIQERYRQLFGRESAYIPYGAPLIRSRRPEVLSRFGLRPRGYFFIASRLEPENHQDIAVEAFRRVNAGVCLAIAGSARRSSAYARKLITVKDPRIRFLGPVYDRDVVDELFCGAYGYIHGNEVGGTNPALLQAMGAGCPIVALDTVFNRETLGDAGWYFRPDATDLAEKILWLVRNPDQAKAGGDNARARAAWLYTWEDVADRTERLLRAVATGRDE